MIITLRISSVHEQCVNTPISSIEIIKTLLFIFEKSSMSTNKTKLQMYLKGITKNKLSKPWRMHFWKAKVQKKKQKQVHVTEYVTVWFTKLTKSDNEGNKGPSSKQNV